MTLKFVGRLGALDVKSVARDPMLRWVAGLPLAVGLAVRWLLPLLARRVGGSAGLDVTGTATLVMGDALLLLGPMLYGMVVGFLLLDQRDDRTLLAVQVTPVPLGRYLLLKLAAPLLVSAVVTPLALLCAGLPPPSPGGLALVVLAAAPLAPLLALTLAAFGQNKVQGFALLKGLSALLIVPIAAQWAPPPWRWLAGALPTYWPARLYAALLAGEPHAGWYAVGALVVDGLLLWLLLRRFRRVMYR